MVEDIFLSALMTVGIRILDKNLICQFIAFIPVGLRYSHDMLTLTVELEGIFTFRSRSPWSLATVAVGFREKRSCRFFTVLTGVDHGIGGGSLLILVAGKDERNNHKQQ